MMFGPLAVNKNLVFSFCLMFFLFLSASSQALRFSYDNYSSIPGLRYSFTFDGVHWIYQGRKDFLVPWDFEKVEFGATIPLAWRVEAGPDGEMYCWDYFDKRKREVESIVILSDKRFIKEDNLLLDVIDGGKDSILIRVIDLDGNQTFSNTICCCVG